MDRRNTVQKALVLSAVYALACHPTADEVYAEVTKSYASISKATVYRNLNMLCDNKKLTRVPMPDMADRFDHRVEGHYHIVCEHCKAFADAPCGYDYELDKRVESTTGFKNASHRVLLTGMCPKCALQNV